MRVAENERVSVRHAAGGWQVSWTTTVMGITTHHSREFSHEATE